MELSSPKALEHQSGFRRSNSEETKVFRGTHVSTIDDETSTGDVRCGGGEQEEGRVGNVFARSESLSRDVLDCFVSHILRKRQGSVLSVLLCKTPLASSFVEERE